MSQPITYEHAISGLIQKRNELFIECETAMNRIATLKNDILAIDRVLKAFGFDGDVNAHMTRPYFLTALRRGDTLATIKEELQKASTPLSTRQIAETIIAIRGMDNKDRKYVENVRRAVTKHIGRLKSYGSVRAVSEQNGSTKWIWQGHEKSASLN